MDTIAQVIHECETCAAIKQPKRLKPLWYGGEVQFPNIQSKPPLAQLEAISSCPITCYLGEETDPHLSTTSYQTLPPLKQINTPTQLGVVCKLTETALNPFVQIIDKDIKQNWPQHRALGNTTFDRPPTGMGVTFANLQSTGTSPVSQDCICGGLTDRLYHAPTNPPRQVLCALQWWKQPPYGWKHMLCPMPLPGTLSWALKSKVYGDMAPQKELSGVPTQFSGTHFQNNLIDTWAKEHGIEW
ncbi:hypothetical protein QYF61_004517, partial [Mycteria americana]